MKGPEIPTLDQHLRKRLERGGLPNGNMLYKDIMRMPSSKWAPFKKDQAEGNPRIRSFNIIPPSERKHFSPKTDIKKAPK